ncbi:MAG: hypothetical protein K1X67_07400 [Fimbriimonadaceae bacterium]|nr:hypothetical protein [Fimbriimonadaceae bacterium]
MIRAVVDVGSNSVLLTVAEKVGEGWRTVAEATRVTGLGRGTKQSGVLSEEAMGDTLQGLREVFEIARAHGANEVLAAATMAARIASNTADFQDRARAQGTPVDVLSGEDEASLGFLSVANDPLFASAARVSIIDPGGHSTELVTADRKHGGWDVLFRRSYPIGTLGLRGSVLSEESPSLAARLAAVREIDQIIGLEYLPHQCGTVVTLGATGTNLITIRERMTTWQPERVHGQVLDYEEIGRAVGWMFDLDDAGRAAIVGIEPGREGTVHIGALILERFLFALHGLECAVSVRGWRHALLEKMGHELAAG